MRKKVLCMFFLLFVFSSAYSLVSAKYTERIDSIITDVNMYGMMKYVFLYDAEGLLSEKIAYSQEDMDGKWTVSERRGYGYDENDRISSVVVTDVLNEEYVGCTSFAYDQNAPVSSVMGLSSPEVLSTDWALRYEMNLTSKPISVTAEMGILRPHQEKSLYYYSAISGE